MQIMDTEKLTQTHIFIMDNLKGFIYILKNINNKSHTCVIFKSFLE